jgi:ATP-dependent HslUV protease ATP-binding subunit HslU
MSISSSVFTPRETVSELDRYIVGQNKAKRAVALALRNRWRRQRVDEELRDDISPKNIIMIGPTGVGKTEIARRLAKLSNAPFIKVEASKFTEIGYVGRDVESMIRDLTNLAVTQVKKEESLRMHSLAERKAEDRILDILMPTDVNHTPNYFAVAPSGEASPSGGKNKEREFIREQLRSGDFDDQEITISVQQGSSLPFEMIAGPGMEDMMGQLKDAFGQMGGHKRKDKSMKVKDALRLYVEEEAEKLIDMDQAVQIALDRVQNHGIIFLDEIDKIAGSGRRGGQGGADVSRGGVQRDLLPIVEGSTVSTKHGVVKTDHILFVAAGAFHETKVSDLIPELQGRFPIRVELDALTEDDFYLILKEPKNSLIKQYNALLETEGVTLSWSEEGIRALAHFAYEANTRLENIGARRLHTVLETLLEEISFKAPEQKGQHIMIDHSLVEKRLGAVLEDEDLSRYIL